MRDPSDIRGAGDVRGPLERHLRSLQDEITALKGPIHNAAHSSARWERVSTQTITTASTTTVIYPVLVQEDDPNGNFTMDTGTGILTINNPGWYLVSAGANWTFTFTGTVTAGTHNRHLLLVSGGSSRAQTTGYFSSEAVGDTVSTIIYLAAADTIFAQVRQVTGSNRTLGGVPSTFFAISKIRE